MTLFAEPYQHPESVLLSIYNAYPRKTGRPAALKRISEALDRICQGEIDGSPRTQAEAIEFLRVKTEEARRQMGARIQKNIPHPATFYNGRRYLRPELTAIVAQPKRMQACIEILAEYPNIDRHALIDSTDVYLPALNAIDKALERMEKKLESQHTYCLAQNAARRLKSRTELYAMAVKQWPVEDLKFVPNPIRWYSESRFEQNEESWRRQAVGGYSEDRQQLARIIDRRNQAGGSGNFSDQGNVPVKPN